MNGEPNSAAPAARNELRVSELANRPSYQHKSVFARRALRVNVTSLELQHCGSKRPA